MRGRALCSLRSVATWWTTSCACCSPTPVPIPAQQAPARPAGTYRKPVLFFANKCDLPHALSADEVKELLMLDELRARAYHVQPSCASSGEGLWQGLGWLAANVKRV